MKSSSRKLGTVLSMRLSDSKNRAKAKNLKHDITLSHLKLLWKQCAGKCPISGVKFSLIAGDPDVPSLDQIHPGKGYTTDNVWLICDWVNKAKGSMESVDILYDKLKVCYNNLEQIKNV